MSTRTLSVTIAILALGLVGAALFGVFSEEESIESAPTVPRKQDPAGVVDDDGVLATGGEAVAGEPELPAQSQLGARGQRCAQRVPVDAEHLVVILSRNNLYHAIQLLHRPGTATGSEGE